MLRRNTLRATAVAVSLLAVCSAISALPSIRICEPEPAISTTSPIADSASPPFAGLAVSSSVKLLTSLMNSCRF